MGQAGPPTKEMIKKLGPVEAALVSAGLAYPGATEDFPWGHRALKVNGKAFVFMGFDENGLGLSVKLPESGSMALTLPFAEPTGYGLGKSGWVSARFTAKDNPPLPMLLEWLEESYRAVAPKKLAAQLGAAAPAPKAAAKKAAVKKAAVKKRRSGDDTGGRGAASGPGEGAHAGPQRFAQRPVGDDALHVHLERDHRPGDRGAGAADEHPGADEIDGARDAEQVIGGSLRP